MQRGFADPLRRHLQVGTRRRPRRSRALLPGRGSTASSVRGAPCTERGPSALQGSRLTPSPALPRQKGLQHQCRLSRRSSIPAAILFSFYSEASRVAARDREPPFATAHRNRLPRGPRVTGRAGTASFARPDRVDYGRMTEGSRALSECDRHLDARNCSLFNEKNSDCTIEV
ncbi:hypothetical protein NDU88_005509 [Pleurodeles waltl]|uniref:Uncharacterized protein n=1 Tax=Pleurodeles waltl TaxID=8319 RepID=A0AAV7MY56_PLEWA|nr:hypothetical protein NDU88_005509 [Pleurodeles waltl]